MRISLLDKDFQTVDLVRQVLGISPSSCMPEAGSSQHACRAKVVLLLSSGHASW